MLRSKEELLRQLANERRTTDLTDWGGASDVSQYHDGAYDGPYVSPYSKSANNVDSDLFILLQDWSSASFLQKPLNAQVAQLGMDPRLKTNINLQALLARHFGRTLASTYATNLFPFIKPGGLSAPMPRELLVRAAKRFALAQVRIVRPKAVICLGLTTFNAMRQAAGGSPVADLATALASAFSHEGACYYAQAHPGHFGQITRNRGGVDRVSADWRTMAANHCTGIAAPPLSRDSHSPFLFELSCE